MEPSEIQETEELALLAELARPVVHECNNFLNNLLLQLAISENDLPESQRPDWERIRQAGKTLGRLLQQWQRQRTHFAVPSARAEVQPLVLELVDASRRAADPVLLSLHMPTEPIWLACPRAEAKRLYSALLRHAIAELRERGNAPYGLEIQIRLIDGAIIFAVRETGTTPASLSWREFEADIQSPTLLVAACQSLTERLRGSIRIDNVSLKQPSLLLALPAVG